MVDTSGIGLNELVHKHEGRGMESEDPMPRPRPPMGKRYSYACCRRRAAAKPASPSPSRASAAGSGTGTAELAENEPWPLIWFIVRLHTAGVSSQPTFWNTPVPDSTRLPAFSKSTDSVERLNERPEMCDHSGV